MLTFSQVYMAVAKDHDTNLIASGSKPDELGLVNQHGLSRKVHFEITFF